ncbi:MAG: SRPBCC family protein [Jiangellaceae bacterium]
MWFWPTVFATEAAFDPRVGGVYAIRKHGAARRSEHGRLRSRRRGHVPGRLVITWRWDGEDDESTVHLGRRSRPRADRTRPHPRRPDVGRGRRQPHRGPDRLP